MYSNKSNITIPFSTNWQEIALFIAQHKDQLDYVKLSQANRRLNSALDMTINYSDGMANVGVSAQIGSFLKAYRSNLPKETVDVLEKSSKGKAKLGMTQIQGDMTMKFLNGF